MLERDISADIVEIVMFSDTPILMNDPGKSVIAKSARDLFIYDVIRGNSLTRIPIHRGSARAYTQNFADDFTQSLTARHSGRAPGEADSSC